MKRYLIEVPHENSQATCNLAVSVFKSTGSHWLASADFGCPDGVHKAWITMDANSKQEALYIVPPPFRDKATVILVKRFALLTVDKTLKPKHRK